MMTFICSYRFVGEDDVTEYVELALRVFMIASLSMLVLEKQCNVFVTSLILSIKHCVYCCR